MRWTQRSNGTSGLHTDTMWQCGGNMTTYNNSKLMDILNKVLQSMYTSLIISQYRHIICVKI